MTQQRHQKVFEIFSAASDLKPQDRSAFLVKECGNDSELRAEIESLLQYGEKMTPSILSSLITQDRIPKGDNWGEASALDIASKLSAGPLSTDEFQSLIGSRYKLTSVAGKGGMGTVMAAVDTVLGRRVAIKLLHSQASSSGLISSSDPMLRQRILNEARAMAGLSHPNICKVHEVSLDGPVPFIVMDWIDGIHLHEAWRRTDLQTRLGSFVKVVDAVAAAHSVGLIHRDLKPTNILVDWRGEPILVDFGLARSDSKMCDGQHTNAGTPAYAAPEQFDPNTSIGVAADVYSLGVLLFQLMTNQVPFHADSMAELMRMIREQNPPIPESVAPNLPWPLQRICLTALERDPRDRYADATAMGLDLSRYLRGETVTARPTMLARQFGEQIEIQIASWESWQRQGLVTETEGNRIRRILHQLLQPESHWVLDSRKLSMSQVTLFLGAWLILIALTIGLFRSWKALEEMPLLRLEIGWLVFVFMLAVGIHLNRRGNYRVSLGYLMTACLVTPIAMWLVLRENGWLAAGFTGSTSKELLYESFMGLHNAQLLVIGLVWGTCAMWLRFFNRSSTFTPLIVLSAALIWASVWASAGQVDYSSSRAQGAFGVYFLAIGAPGFWLGLRLNRNEELIERKVGRARFRTRDSWSVLVGALAVIIVGLTLIAWSWPEWLFRGSVVTSRAIAFLVNGIVLQMLAFGLERSKTIVRSRLAEFIRWITPQLFLGPIVALEYDAMHGANRSSPLAWFWVVVLYTGATAFCYLSVLRQWRPFLVTGLVYLGVVYFKTFELMNEDIPKSWLDTAQIALTMLTIVLGAIIMGISWKSSAFTRVSLDQKPRDAKTN